VEKRGTWLTLATFLGGAGVTLLVASSASRWCDPLFYVGGALFLIAAYIALAVLFVPLPLLPLRSEREAKRFQEGLDSLLTRGQALDSRTVASDDDLAKLQSDYAVWIQDGTDWLQRHASPATANDFLNPSGAAARVTPSFNGEHSQLRLTVSWRLEILREVRRERLG
jgi:hypothetical protein